MAIGHNFAFISFGMRSSRLLFVTTSESRPNSRSARSDCIVAFYGRPAAACKNGDWDTENRVYGRTIPSSAEHSGRNGSHTKRNLCSHEFAVANEATKQQTSPELVRETEKERVWPCVERNITLNWRANEWGKNKISARILLHALTFVIRVVAAFVTHEIMMSHFTWRGDRGNKAQHTRSKCNFQTIKCMKLDSLVNLQVFWRWQMVFIYHYLAFHLERMPSHRKCVCETGD